MKKQNIPQDNKITRRAIIVLSTLQLLMYILLLFTIYSANHDNNPTDLDGLEGVVPAGLFVLFGVVNIIFLIVYAVQLVRSKKKPQPIIVALGIGLVLLYVFLGPMISFVDSL